MKIKKGFTLVELLVVISIIALLLSMLMPSLSKARELSRRTVCKTQLHQLGITYHTYAGDNRSKLILAWPFRADQGTVPYFLHRPMYDHLKKSYNLTSKFWMCPSLNVQGNRNPEHPHLQKANETAINVKYRQVGELAHHPSDSQTLLGGYSSLTHLKGITAAYNFPVPDVPESPATTADKGTKHLAADVNVRYLTWSNIWSVSAHRKKMLRSGEPDGGNRLYLDGHCEWIAPKKMGYQDGPLETEGKYTWARGLRYVYW